mmetsp:Transcript_49722/g.82515  ORF Transcript_49722/g.82515 Transcript_49722/m.82515 type:complete len:348 (+) Transcript_49722:179-1222(+)
MFISSRATGVLIAFASVLAVSPDAMLLRSMRSLGASSPDVAVAKYIGIIACMIVIGSSKGVAGTKQSMPHFFASSFCQLLYQLSFTFCLLLTDAAKAMLLISLAPLWAAFLGRFVLKESIPARTGAALAASMVGVALVFIPRLMHGDQTGASSPLMQDSLQGDLLAVATGFAQGASLTVNRHAALHCPQADLTLATALSSLTAAVVAIEMPCYDNAATASQAASFWACTPPLWHTLPFILLAFLDALAVALFYTSMLVAPRYLTGSEVALVSLLDVVLEPLWVYLRFGDVPGLWTLGGGAVLLTTLAAHECAGGRSHIPPAPAPVDFAAEDEGGGEQSYSYHSMDGE